MWSGTVAAILPALKEVQDSSDWRVYNAEFKTLFKKKKLYFQFAQAHFHASKTQNKYNH